MATAHCKTQRAKSNTDTIVIPKGHDKAWADYLESNKPENIDHLRAEGWRTIQDLAEQSGESDYAIRGRMIRDKRIESKLVRCFIGSKLRDVRIFRPK